MIRSGRAAFVRPDFFLSHPPTLSVTTHSFSPTAIVFQQEADGAVQAVCYANLVMSTTLPIPLSASLTAERRELLFPTLSAAQIERIAAHGKPLCLAKTRSTFEINKMQRGCVTCYMGPAGAVMGQTRFSVGTHPSTLH